MRETVKTGGTKEFVYTKEDMKRIRSSDTDFTREFKEAYHKWQERRAKIKQVKNIATITLLVLIILFFYILS